MQLRDWALITFTILAQMSVGSFFVLALVHLFATRKAGLEEADRLSDRSQLAIIVVLALGLIASLFHLGNPLTAYKAVTNFGSSWLSREVLFGVSFFVLGVIYTFMQWRKIASPGLRNVLCWITALVGLVLVYCMSSVYMLPAQPAWNTLATPVMFYATTLLLGSLAMGVAFVVNYAYVQRKEPGCAESQCGLLRDAMRWIAVASIVLLGVELVVLPIYVASLAAGSAAAVQSAQLMTGHFLWAFILRIVLVFIGAGLFALFLYQNALSPGQEKLLGKLAYFAFALVLIAEVLGRFVFYATAIRIGI